MRHRRKKTQNETLQNNYQNHPARDWNLRHLLINSFSPSVENCFPGVLTLCFEGLSALSLTLERNLRCESGETTWRALELECGSKCLKLFTTVVLKF